MAETFRTMKTLTMPRIIFTHRFVAAMTETIFLRFRCFAVFMSFRDKLRLYTRHNITSYMKFTTGILEASALL